MELITKMHKAILGNVEKVQQNQKKTYVMWKGRQMFPSFVVGKDIVKMKKQSKKRALEASWKGPYLFVGYAARKNEINLNEGGCICIIKMKLIQMKWGAFVSLKGWKRLSDNDLGGICNFFILQRDLMEATRV